MSDLTGLRALVTGGASGIGEATARLLQSRGARVAVLDLDTGGVGPPFVAVAADVTDDDAVRSAVAEAVEQLGGLDILVNNAGGVSEPLYPQAPLEHWERVLDVNLRAVMLATQLALEPLRRRGGGAIVNVSSVAGLGAGPHVAPEYAAAKAGVVRLTAALGSLADEGIRVNAICPDYVDTPAVRRDLAQMTEDERAAVPELVSPDAVASGVVDLIRDDSLAGRVLVWFAEEEPYLLPVAVPQ
jgi:NAD(P)-dependent dehydrogenase (short-subunit alcohol dehydrogenase family)